MRNSDVDNYIYRLELANEKLHQEKEEMQAHIIRLQEQLVSAVETASFRNLQLMLLSPPPAKLPLAKE